MEKSEKKLKDLISSESERVYKDLFQKLQHESGFKHLKNISLKEILNATNACNSSQNEESQKRRMHFSEICVLTESIDDAITQLIDDTFQSSYINEFRMKLLKAINSNSVQLPETMKSPYCSKYMSVLTPKTSEILVDKVDLEELKSISKRYEKNLRDISKQMIEMPVKEIKQQNSALYSKEVESDLSSCEIKEEVLSDVDVSDISVSSVHTSELSSFDDEISISSDEGTGKKRRKISLKAIHQNIEEYKTNKSMVIKKDAKNKRNIETTDSEQSESSINVDESSESEDDYLPEMKNKSLYQRKTKSKVKAEKLQNESSTSQKKSLPTRIRKPNVKYASEEMISPFSVDPMYFENKQRDEEAAAEGLKEIDSVQRKRGRPSKIL